MHTVINRATGGCVMSDDALSMDEPAVSGALDTCLGRDHLRINLQQDHQVRYWAAKFGVTEQNLHRAVAAAGIWSDDVENQLRRGLG